MTTVSRTLGARIHAARRKKGITSNRLAELCGVGAVHIRKIESGVKLPSIPRFIMICNALETSPQYLLQDSLDLNDSDALRLLDKLQALPPSQLALAAKHNGRVCKQHCCYDRTAKNGTPDMIRRSVLTVMAAPAAIARFWTKSWTPGGGMSFTT